MTAIFFAKPGRDSVGESEYKRYEAFANAHGFSEGSVRFGDALYDTQPCYFKRIGEKDFCVFCENIKGKDFLLFGKINENIATESEKKERITDLLDYALDVAVAIDGDDEVVRLFWHNGGDIPNGYEQWANQEISGRCEYGNWRLALLSSTRNGIFNFDDIGANKLGEALEDESKFGEWVDELGNKLKGGRGDGRR